MFRNRFHSCNAVFRRGVRRLTTAEESGASATVKPQSRFTRTKNFFLGYRQQIMNTIGFSYIVYYAIYNAKVQVAWDEREAEVAVIKSELDELKSVLQDETWLGEADKQIKNEGSTIRRELGLKIRGLYKADPTRFVTGDATTGGSGML